MTHRSLHALVTALALASAACGSGSSAPDPPASAAVAASASEVSSAIVELTNTERARAGLPTLRVNSRLNQAAELQAEQVAQVQVLEHDLAAARYPTPPDRLAAAGYQWLAWGENLAMGQRSAGEAVQAWMDSPGHRANILNGNFTEIGAAYAVDSRGRPYYVQEFGKPR